MNLCKIHSQPKIKTPAKASGFESCLKASFASSGAIRNRYSNTDNRLKNILFSRTAARGRRGGGGLRWGGREKKRNGEKIFFPGGRGGGGGSGGFGERGKTKRGEAKNGDLKNPGTPPFPPR